MRPHAVGVACRAPTSKTCPHAASARPPMAPRTAMRTAPRVTACLTAPRRPAQPWRLPKLRPSRTRCRARPIEQEAQHLVVERVGALPHRVVPGVRQHDSRASETNAAIPYPSAMGVMASCSPQTTSVGAVICVKCGSQSACNASTVAATALQGWQRSRSRSQQRRKPRRPPADGPHRGGYAPVARVPVRPDRGIDEHEPVDAVWMARGQPRRHGAAEGVPGDDALAADPRPRSSRRAGPRCRPAATSGVRAALTESRADRPCRCGSCPRRRERFGSTSDRSRRARGAGSSGGPEPATS